MSDDVPGMYETNEGLVRGCGTVLALLFLTAVMLLAIGAAAVLVFRAVMT